MVGATLVPPANRAQAGHAEASQPAQSAVTTVRGEHRCECGHILRVFGLGRHRVYFEPGDARLDDPVMDRACPQCGRGLPGKNRS